MEMRNSLPDEHWFTKLKFIDLDKAKNEGILSGRDFIIDAPQGLKKDTKADRSIYSHIFGEDVYDKNAFIDRYRCRCGKTRGTLYNNYVCPVCHTKCTYKDNDFNIFGWIVLKHHKLIHPSLFNIMRTLIGTKILDDIMTWESETDVDGFTQTETVQTKEKSSIFAGIGIIEMIRRIDEIIDYFGEKNRKKPNKYEAYLLLKENRDKLLTSSIPVYTLFLRRATVQGDSFSFKGDNALYNSMAKHMEILNNSDKDFISGQYKMQERSLFRMQKCFNKLCDSIIKTLSGKKGVIRSVIGGRYNYSGRAVIVPDPTLRVDEIKLPYAMLVVLNEQLIVNILMRTFSMEYAYAYKKWWNAQLTVDPDVLKILQNIIKSKPRGDAYLVGRNPSINFGSMLHMYCIDIVTESFTMKMPLQVLKGLAADFDGDCMNVLKFINDEFEYRCALAFNPRNSMMVSHKDGKFNNDTNIFKDEVININAFMYTARDAYSKKELANIASFKAEDHD